MGEASGLMSPMSHVATDTAVPASEKLDMSNPAPVASHMARSGPSTGPRGLSAMNRTIRTAAAAGLLALGSLSLSACSVVASIAPGLAPSPTPTSIAGHNPSDVNILKDADGSTPPEFAKGALARQTATAGLQVMDAILLAHPETQHGSFAQTQQNWDSTMRPALKPLLRDDILQGTEKDWVAGEQSVVLTNVIGVPDAGKSPVGITWSDSTGKACTLAEQPFDVSLEKPSVGASHVGAGGYVFEDVAVVVMHCKEGTSIHAKIAYHMVMVGNGHAGMIVTDWDRNTPGGLAIQ